MNCVDFLTLYSMREEVVECQSVMLYPENVLKENTDDIIKLTEAEADYPPVFNEEDGNLMSYVMGGI